MGARVFFVRIITALMMAAKLTFFAPAVPVQAFGVEPAPSTPESGLPPIASDDEYSTNEDSGFTIPAPGILLNDIDPEDDPLEAILVNGVSSGTLLFNPDGSFSYTPALNFTGDITFTYNATDTTSLSNLATTLIKIVAVNDPPTLNPDTANTEQNIPVLISVLVNDSDVDGTINPASVTVATSPTHGSTQVIVATGQITYTPAVDYIGTDSFTYQVCDDQAACASAGVSLTITAPNVPPVANPDTATTPEDTAVVINVLANDSDVDGTLDPASVTVTVAPAQGSTQVNLTTGAITYTPTSNYNGADSFTYQVCDDQADCDTALVSVTVTAANDPPVANPDSTSTPEDTAVVINVLANDSDIDGTLDPASVTVETPPTQGSTLVNPTTGAITYTPASNYNGADNFTYQVCDDQADCDTALVSITVTAVNDPPVANPDTTNTVEDTAVVVSVLANDSDVDGTLEPASVTVTVAPTQGSTLVNPTTGAITYTPGSNYNGADSFTYQVCDNLDDCASALVSVTVTAVNDPPVANPDSTSAPEDTAVVINVLANDSDIDGTLDPASVTVETPPTHGSTLVNPTTGAITYTPSSNYNGADNFTYQVCDDQADCDTALVSITVTAVNDPPIANPDTTNTVEDTAVVINVLANDSDIDGTLDPATVSVETLPEHGSTQVNLTTGAITYTPASNYNGADSFTYRVCDDLDDCSSALVSVTVTAVNDPPVANPDSTSTPEDTAVVINVLANDSDVDGTLNPASVTVETLPAHGSTQVNLTTGAIIYTPSSNYNGTDSFTYQVCDNQGVCDTAVVSLTVTSVNDAPVANADIASTPENTNIILNVLANDSDIDGTLVPASVTVLTPAVNGTTEVIVATGQISYTPDLHYNGADSFTYQVCDNQGACDSAGVSITITSVNDPPIANPDSTSTGEDTPVLVNVLANDSDIDGTLNPASVTVTVSPAHGSTQVNLTTGGITYTPALNYNGTDNFTYQVCDNQAACAEAQVLVDITPINDPPVAQNDSAITPEDTMIAVQVTANDQDVDGNLNIASVQITTPPSHGSAVATAGGQVQYTPNLNYNGTDSLQYQVCDTALACSNIASVNLTVTSVNDAPVALNDTAGTSEDTAVVINAPNNDSDVDGNLDLTSVTVTAAPLHGGTTVNALTGAITYTPVLNYFGSDNFTYRICDTNLACATAQVSVTISPVNDPPLAVDDSSSTPEDVTVNINVRSNDSDVDGNLDATSLQVITSPQHGVATVITATWQIRYSPTLNYNGPDSFSYQICDTNDLCDNAVVSVSVTPVNDAPTANNDFATTPEDTPEIIDVLANDLDPDGNLNPASVTVTAVPAHGSTNVNTTTGAITYTPATNYNGADSFVYSVCDTVSSCDTATVSITVGPENDPPIAANDSANTAEDVPITVNILANDSDPDNNIDPTTVTVINPPARGSASVNALNGQITYTPNLNFNGADSLLYQVCDAFNACDSATLALTITPVNDPPVANPDNATTPEDTATVVDVSQNDQDVDGNLSVTSVTIAQNPGHGNATVNLSNGRVNYAPFLNFSGLDTLIYQICDTSSACDSAVVTITVSAVNDPPLANNDVRNILEDTPTALNLLANDNDPDGNLDASTVTVTSQPLNGVTVVNPANGEVLYTPNHNYFGTDQFNYQVCDTQGICDTALVNITIQSVNDAPIAINDTYFIAQDQVLNVGAPGVLTNDSDVDSASLTAVLDQSPTKGSITLQSNGSLVYTPPLGYVGVITFTYHAFDGNLESAFGVVEINVYDTQKPTVAWVQPVETGVRYNVFGRPVLLQVIPEDNFAIDHVVFYRWDPVSLSYVDIATVSNAPFSYYFDVSDLAPEYNQIFAKAFDLAGNASERQSIWLYVYYTEPVTFVPVVSR